MAKILPGTQIAHYGKSAGIYKIGWQGEAEAERAGYIIERRGTSYVYVRRPVRTIWNTRPH